MRVLFLLLRHIIHLIRISQPYVLRRSNPNKPPGNRWYMVTHTTSICVAMFIHEGCLGSRYTATHLTRRKHARFTPLNNLEWEKKITEALKQQRAHKKMRKHPVITTIITKRFKNVIKVCLSRNIYTFANAYQTTHKAPNLQSNSQSIAGLMFIDVFMFVSIKHPLSKNTAQPTIWAQIT